MTNTKTLEAMQAVLDFWFDEITPAQWWKKDPLFDQVVRDRFESLLQAALAGECEHWRHSAQGCLALVILLDQFSRNIFRDQPAAFAADQQALDVAMNAVAQGWDRQLTNQQRHFLYMPYMHSEDAAVHELAVALFGALDGDDSDAFELRHKAIIDRFGRYPHRNAILGRESTPEELAFLQQPGSSF
ncbi:DUF924 family protein [Simiduia aestuariiviva]|uniref:Uncharacterized protein (DUF924 family) n=1 Tax=Simiduia aestuariiviva TaxID=1510459 RepID=A0A839UTI8_9GAMM|nr:DUF924 family protein [Simiduia aestuariiviva]MBB3168818.1 uncharacterized protein (DUF924 family) [Simiduia aestuariiviva]